MRKSQKELNKYLRKNPMGLIYFVGIMGILSLLFAVACLYKIYDSAYTTSLSCDKNEKLCVVQKHDILGNEFTEYTFIPRKLKKAKVVKQKNILKKEVYYLAIEDSKNENKRYLITAESETAEEQEEHLAEIKNYLRNYYVAKFELQNSREKLKQIGFTATAAGSLIAIFLLLDCIKGIKDYKKKHGSGKYDNLIKPSSGLL